LAAFKIRKPGTRLEKGMLVTSIDIDVGCSEIGVINRGKNDTYVHPNLSERAVGAIEEAALPFFVDMFETFEMPVTFALRGQCLDVDKTAVECLLGSSVKHDIGSHGYTHRRFEDLSHSDAEKELNMTSLAMGRYGIVPRSFIFPRDSVDHLDLLEQYGYKCYRSHGSLLRDRMQVEKEGGLYDICPSLHLTRSANALLLKKLLDVAVARRSPFHIWFHLWNFGYNMESIQRSVKRAVFPLLQYAKEKVNIGELSFETMFSVVEKIERSEQGRCLCP
jgi:peptidoglycan/xylan/chitin deacetylase (PgdA/CDA1 family)